MGSNNTGFETVIGKHGLGEMSDNGELFADFCSFNKLIIGGSVFPHKKVHKVTWVSPDNWTENQIDRICVSSRFRRLLFDVRVKRRADVASDLHLLMGRCWLKLKNFNTGRKKTSYKHNIEMLKVEETKKRFQLTISNKYGVLASLQENKENLSKGKDQRAVNQLWQGIKDAWRETCEETLERKSKQHRAYASVDTLNKIEVRKKAKEVLNRSKTRVRKAEAQAKYSDANKEVKRSNKTGGTL